MKNKFQKQDKEFIVLNSSQDHTEFIKIAKKLNIKKLFVFSDKKIVETKELKLKIIPQKKLLTVTKENMRNVIEQNKDSYLCDFDKFFLEFGKINQVLAKICKERNHIILFSLGKIFELSSKDRIRVMCGFYDTLRLFLKYDVPFYICSLSDNPLHMRQQIEKESFLRVFMPGSI